MSNLVVRTSERLVVVGGGIVGCSAAYELASRGLAVTLVDREDPGHATQAGAGIVSGAAPGATPGAALTRAAVAFYPGLVQRLADDGIAETGWSRSHGLLVAEPGQEDQLRDLYEALQDGPTGGSTDLPSVRLLEAGEATHLLPLLREDLAAIHVEEAARVDGRSFRHSLRTAFSRRGGEIRIGDGRLVLNGTRLAGVEVDGERIASERVLLCTGAWARELVPGLEVEPQRGQLVHLATPGHDPAGWPFVEDFRAHYLVSFPGRVVVGATRETHSGFDHRLTADGLLQVLSSALRIAPGLAGATVLETRVGFRPLSSDGLPVVGPVPGSDGLFLATGMGPSGLTVGPFCGATLARLALGERPAIDVDAFGAQRAGVAADGHPGT